MPDVHHDGLHPALADLYLERRSSRQRGLVPVIRKFFGSLGYAVLLGLIALLLFVVSGKLWQWWTR